MFVSYFRVSWVTVNVDDVFKHVLRRQRVGHGGQWSRSELNHLDVEPSYSIYSGSLRETCMTPIRTPLRRLLTLFAVRRPSCTNSRLHAYFPLSMVNHLSSNLDTAPPINRIAAGATQIDKSAYTKSVRVQAIRIAAPSTGKVLRSPELKGYVVPVAS